MAVAHSIFTLGEAVQLFWALGYKKNVFWPFQKNNHDVTLRLHLGDLQIGVCMCVLWPFF